MRRSYILLFVLVFALCASVYVLQPSHFAEVSPSAGAASVLQSVWSVVAVVVALLLPSMVAEGEAKRKSRLLAEIATTAWNLMAQGANGCRSSELCVAFGQSYHLEEWETALHSLNAFPVDSLETGDQVQDLLKLQGEMTGAVKELRSAELRRSVVDASTLWGSVCNCLSDAFDRATPAFDRLKARRASS